MAKARISKKVDTRQLTNANRTATYPSKIEKKTLKFG